VKRIFRISEIIFLGYKVSAKGSQLLERVTHFHDCQPSKTASQLSCFLSMLNFYRRFVPHAVEALLHDVLSGPRVKDSHPIT
jgi:hypothetical protein